MKVAPGDAHYRCRRRHFFEHYGVCTDLCSIADQYIAQHLGPSAEVDSVTESGRLMRAIKMAIAEGAPLTNDAVVPDDRIAVHHNALVLEHHAPPKRDRVRQFHVFDVSAERFSYTPKPDQQFTGDAVRECVDVLGCSGAWRQRGTLDCSKLPGELPGLRARAGSGFETIQGPSPLLYTDFRSSRRASHCSTFWSSRTFPVGCRSSSAYPSSTTVAWDLYSVQS